MCIVCQFLQIFPIFTDINDQVTFTVYFVRIMDNSTVTIIELLMTHEVYDNESVYIY